jgi:2,3-bisphosphoglycerate-independent phosphoglycerate mutase
VQAAVDSGAMFRGQVWQEIVQQVKTAGSSLHFIGLLSDGNVHAHEQHLYAMMRRAAADGVRKMRIHVLFDGRDVPERSAEIYVERLEAVIAEVGRSGCDVRVASGGGRMVITMDRYEADWKMVERGWDLHVRGNGDVFPNLKTALTSLRATTGKADQYLPGFVIGTGGHPNGPIVDGDGVVFFNFRGDRAIEITRAFTDKQFKPFDRGAFPKVIFAGMMEYDGDLHLPQKYLVNPPEIADTLGQYLAEKKVRQFACSETQKFGHVTYFWNGNRSGYFDAKWEEYLEVPSDNLNFDLKPWMKAYEITEATIDRLHRNTFDFGRINFANGDMVGHTGNFQATVIAVATVDLMIGRLMEACRATGTTLVVTADHGNAEEMYDGKEANFPSWKNLTREELPPPKTAHTLSPVPFYVYNAPRDIQLSLAALNHRSLANVANTCLKLLGESTRDLYLPSLIESI